MNTYVTYGFAVVSATLLFVLRIGEVSLANLLVGAVLATLLVWLLADTVFGEPGAPTPLRTRLLAFFPFAVAVTRHVLDGTGRVVRMVVAAEPDPQPSVVDVPFGERHRLGVYVTGLSLTLSPGSYLLDIDWEAKTLYFHAIGVDDPEATREQFQSLYRDYQQAVFP